MEYRFSSADIDRSVGQPTFTEVIEARGVQKDSILWENLRMEYRYHLDNPGKQWGIIWHAQFGCGDNPPYSLPLE